MESTLGSTPKMDWESSDLPTSWKTFKQHVQFMFEGPLKSKNEETKCNYLMIWVGNKGRDIYSTWNLQVAEAKLLKTYYEKFENYVKPKSNKLYARYKFTTRKQSDVETFEQFVTDLRILINDCDYQQKEEMLRDQIVFTVKSQKIREKLINEGSDLTLEKAIDIARTYELSKQQLRSMNGEDTSIHALKKKPSAHTSTRREEYVPRKYNSQRNSKCGKCGRDHRRNEQCPAEGKKCNKCLKMNHFAAMCKTKQNKSRDFRNKKNIHTISESDSSSDGEFYVGTIDDPIHTIDNTWYETLKINNQPIRFQLDTGAKYNFISTKTFSKLNLDVIKTKPDISLKSYSDSTSVLGGKACADFELIKRLYTIQTDDNQIIESNQTNPIPEDIRKNYADIFKGKGCIPGEHSIQIDSTVQPVVHAPRKIPIAIKDKVKEELQRMEQNEIIVKQSEPTPLVNSMVTVIKPKTRSEFV
ncbi:unnamed protein product [Mytilus edulis]|uniref:Uncharacterized protein n=1 Tax=Mytilus edulis TaxID=6550 RepID=A0A8S3PQK6_MYTED|nr:unnamed protein product [Mytilus edulis]